MMYKIVVVKFGKERIVEAYGEDLNEAIQKVKRADFRVNEVKTKEINSWAKLLIGMIYMMEKNY